MKHYIFALFVLLLTSSVAVAGWQDTFSDDFAQNGVETVKNLLARGVSAKEIIDVASQKVEPQLLVQAMCEAGLTPGDLDTFLALLGNMSPNELVTLCGGQGNISPVLKYPGAAPDSFSVSKGTNYSGDGTFPRPGSVSRP